MNLDSLNLWEQLADLADPSIKAKAFIYVEADRDLAQLTLPATWKLIKETKAGTVRAGLFQKIPDASNSICAKKRMRKSRPFFI